MYKEKVGKVTEKEKAEVIKLHERKLALTELAQTLNSSWLSEDDKKGIYQRIVDDLGKTMVTLEEWWVDMQKKYGWKGAQNGKYSINFETNEIYLITDELALCK